MRTKYMVGFYEIDRNYGGQEEGGWWYDTGELVRPYKVFNDEESAITAARRANDILHVLQRHLREVGSVIYDGGRYSAEVYEDNLPNYYPEVRPHYE